jgi:hypothetical protein
MVKSAPCSSACTGKNLPYANASGALHLLQGK